jgi:hypothetical protein
MPNYDLSSANLGRVANQDVDALRIADQMVWSGSSIPTSGARIRPTWTPALQNSPGLYAHGWSFTSTDPVYIPAIWWYQPDHSDISDVIARLYLESDQSILTTITLPQASVVRAAWNRIALPPPYLCSSGLGYRAAVVVSERQSYENSGDFPHVGGPITVSADYYNSGGGYPNTSWSGAHGLDIEWAV